jgi:NAD(P)-dependent dehydrogenase (short-subunit alcohol dehydrogenase family)
MSGQTAFEGCVALITGGGTGIGRATALALARNGADVALAGRRTAELEAAAEVVRAAGRRAIATPTDVTDREQVQRLVDQTLATLGGLDIVVANAGQYVRSPIEPGCTDAFERSMAVNFYGTLYLVLAALPHLKSQRSGHIVIMSSMDGKKGLPPDGPYVAAKFAQAGLGDVLRQELRPYGVGVSVIFPGRVDTPLIETLEVPRISAKAPPEAVAQAVVRAIRRRTPQVVLPPNARLLLLADRLSPHLSDWAIQFFHLEGWEKAK